MSLPLRTYTQLQPQLMAFVHTHGYTTPLPADSAGAALAYETLHSLLSACQTSHTKRNHRHILTQQAQRVARYEQGASISTLAAELHLPPTKVARDLLEGLLQVRRSAVKDLLRAPESITHCQLREDSVARLAQLEQPAPRFLARLAGDVAHCVASDLKDSPLLDCVREWSGEEHEWRLAASLCAAGIPAAAMLTEEELRAGAYRRSTPDILLRWPIAIPCPHAPPGAPAPWRLVSWLDSKASFADPLALDDSGMGVGRQVKKYLADFGPGMAVFWGGWVDSLVSAAGVAGEGFAGGLTLHHRPPAVWRWATVEERALAEAFRAGRAEEEEEGQGATAGLAAAAGAGAQEAGQDGIFWSTPPVAGGAVQPQLPGAAQSAAAAAQHHAAWQAMLEAEAGGCRA